MHLSRRVNELAPSSTLAVTARIKELIGKGVDVIGFGAGEPDFDTPDTIKQAAINALLEGHTKYAPVAGELVARDAVARKLRDENNIECAAENIVITVGGKHAIYLVLQCLLDEDVAGPPEVILPTPAWVSFAPMIQLAGGKTIQVPGAVENDFLITPEQLEEAITPHTKAVIFNSPSNPCGTMYSEAQLRALADVLKPREETAIITDELYDKLTYGGIAHFSLGSIAEIADRVITIGGLGKAYAMTGWRIGYLCGPRNLADAAAKLQGQMTSNITTFCYPAIVEALTNAGDAVEAMRLAFADRGRIIHELVSHMPGVRCPKPTGAFYVFPDISAHFGRTSPGGTRINSALDFAAALLDEANVAVVPGEDFGDIGRNHVRLSFACSNEHIREGCRRMSEWITRLR
jgi:aspartate aminotransferase